jgi:hypothetical protein
VRNLAAKNRDSTSCLIWRVNPRKAAKILLHDNAEKACCKRSLRLCNLHNRICQSGIGVLESSSRDKTKDTRINSSALRLNGGEYGVSPTRRRTAD